MRISEMVLSKYFLFSILHSALVILPFLVHAQEQSGFISIDCGLSDATSYTDATSGITYVSDASFAEYGENRAISPSYKSQTDDQQLWNLRSFPQGTRNCYTLSPSQGKGTRYFIRARFMYGNYDNNGQSPSFDLYLGVDFWDTVKFDNNVNNITKGIIHTPTSDHIHVCLVNTGYGDPFISVLELRPLASTIYTTEDGLALKLVNHYDFSSATTKVERYKEDVYDRLWFPLSRMSTWIPFINVSSSNAKLISKNEFQIPSTVMGCAYTQPQNISFIGLRVNELNSSATYFLYMHLAELEILQTGQSREFNIYTNDDLFYGPESPVYLKTGTLSSKNGVKANQNGEIFIWLNNTNTATLPPIINAAEVYELKELSGQDTYQTDVEAILGVKSWFGLKILKWQGDPCGPQAFLWDGLNCSYAKNGPSRIVSLKLVSSGLVGEIAPSIANLSKLEYLDMSNNNLTGTVPEFLASLSFLKVLNLTGNKQLTGPIPQALSKKKDLSLSLDAHLMDKTSSCSSCKSKKSFVAPLVASLGGVLFIILVIVAVVWSRKRRKQQNIATDVRVGPAKPEHRVEDVEFGFKKQQFTYSEIQRITNNFYRVLGEGGFGKVYYGHLNGNEVAVKMISGSSIQGHRQFIAELKLLLRVHHKNLTILVGYCNEENNFGLIYEYMAMGNLRSHLSGGQRTVLSWEDRLRIAIDTAQGLEYLHNGCKPPIVHRDVKTTNILLNDKFQAKLGDFGLSKIFPLEGGNHISDTGTVGITTSIAGTPGYLDPEYYITNWLNEKSDVYSFGVVLLEIVTARPVLAKTRENNHIIHWVESMLAKGDIKNIIDPRLGGDNCDTNTVWKTIEIAMLCVSKKSSDRPTMSRVTSELKECLGSELARRDSNDVSYLSKDSSVEMISSTTISEFSPMAR